MATTSENQAAKRWRCTASPILWLIFVLTSMILLGLCYWQLSKGLVRQTQDQSHQTMMQQEQGPLSLQQSYRYWDSQPTTINDSKATINGQLVPNLLILHDNRILDGRAGYGVYGLVKLQSPVKDFSHILVQVGWHPIPQFDRTIMPQLQFETISLQNVEVTLEHIYPDVFTLNQQPPEILTQTVTNTNAISKILRMQTIDFKFANQHQKIKILPFVARATTTLTKPTLKLNQHPIAKRGISAEKHFGYSLQWFIFWGIAVGVFLYTQCSWYHLPQSVPTSEANK